MSAASPRTTAPQGDPTHTKTLRDNFEKDLRRRFRRIRGLIRKTVGYQNDALRLKEDSELPVLVSPNVVFNAEPRESFSFVTDKDKVRQFYHWLLQAIQDEILVPVEGSRESVEDGDHWTAEYVLQAYFQGWGQASSFLVSGGADVEVEDPVMQQLMQMPVAVNQLERLYTRTYENLETVAEGTADEVRRELVTGLARGENPNEIARRLTSKVRDIERNKAVTLARTEIINSHSLAALDRYEEAGVSVVSHGEWMTAKDNRVCAVCRVLDGREFTIREMRNESFTLNGTDYLLRPPAHPNGRCVILPVVGGDASALESLSNRKPSEDEIREERRAS